MRLFVYLRHFFFENLIVYQGDWVQNSNCENQMRKFAVCQPFGSSHFLKTLLFTKVIGYKTQIVKI